MAKYGILKQRDKGYTSQGIFQGKIGEYFKDKDDYKIIGFDFPSGFPLSGTIGRFLLRRKIYKESKKLEKIFIPSQSLLYIEESEVECELICYVHDIYGVTTTFGGLANLLVSNYNARKLEKLNNVVCSSKFTQEELNYRTKFKGRSTVVYQGIDSPEPEKTDRDIDLIYVGGLDARKNPEFVRETIEKAQASGFRCLAVNHSPINLPCDVKINVDEEELYKLYSRSRYYLHASRLEGFGRSPVEAQSQGCIPLAFDNEINKEILGEGFHTIESVGDVLNYLDYSDSNLADVAINNSEKFRWEKFLQSIERIINSY